MNEIAEIEAWIEQVLDLLEEILSTGEKISDELLGQIADQIEHEESRIDQLRKQSPVESLPAQQSPQQPQLQEAMPSSNVESFGYDEYTGKLMVRFLGEHPDRNGPIYAYEGVPKNIFDLFRKGAVPARTDGSNKWGIWWKGKKPSIGASLYALIKNGGYAYERLT